MTDADRIRYAGKFVGGEVEYERIAARLEQLEADDKRWRRLLWLRHGCEGLYGDDGEMQCGMCRMDFKRDDPESIERRWRERGLASLRGETPMFLGDLLKEDDCVLVCDCKDPAHNLYISPNADNHDLFMYSVLPLNVSLRFRIRVALAYIRGQSPWNGTFDMLVGIDRLPGLIKYLQSVYDKHCTAKKES